MEVIKMFYDLETTGLETDKCAIHQFSGEIEVNRKTVETFDLRMRPFKGASISKAALAAGNVTLEQISKYPPAEEAFSKFHHMISKYVSAYDKEQKCFLIGFNNSRFDDPFLRVWFQRNQNKGFDLYFWSHAADVLCLATEYLFERRKDMVNFKLATVATELGIVVEKERLHEAGYDIFLTKSIYNIVTGREMEL